MDNERHAIEAAAPPAGYALAFNGDPIKICCQSCNYYSDETESYQPTWYDCCFDDYKKGMSNLKTWPFKNGCKHFKLHHIFSVDWEEEARRYQEGIDSLVSA